MRDLPGITQDIADLVGLPHDAPLLLQALTHPSFANERRGELDNQRLEFLGDAVLGLCVSELLCARFPDADEGLLTRMRAQLVNAEALAAWGRKVELPVALRLGRGAAGGGLRDSTNVLADAVEALLAAAYLSGGLEQARPVASEIVESGLAALERMGARDPKSELQERLQALGEPAPTYEIVETGGPAHERWFRVRVVGTAGGLGEGQGRSKRAAEQAAAASALEQLVPPSDNAPALASEDP
ncbi:MAG TPA: ribonuclease III [Polyangiaceae bacterium]|nr:ribonuclease III [Polyangiaceae bacterium]